MGPAGEEGGRTWRAMRRPHAHVPVPPARPRALKADGCAGGDVSLRRRPSGVGPAGRGKLQRLFVGCQLLPAGCPYRVAESYPHRVGPPAEPRRAGSGMLFDLGVARLGGFELGETNEVTGLAPCSF